MNDNVLFTFPSDAEYQLCSSETRTTYIWSGTYGTRLNFTLCHMHEYTHVRHLVAFACSIPNFGVISYGFVGLLVAKLHFLTQPNM